jgi:hypothetical protein
MNLRDKVKAKKRPEVEITVDGDTYLVVGLPKSRRAEIYNSVPRVGKSKEIDTDLMENVFLSECVLDPSTLKPVFSVDESSEWGSVPAQITGPLFSEVMRLNGLDNDDVGRKVKNSEATDLPA